MEILYPLFLNLIVRVVFTDGKEGDGSRYSNVTINSVPPQCSVDLERSSFVLHVKLTEDEDVFSSNKTNDSTIKYILRTRTIHHSITSTNEYVCQKESGFVRCRIWKISSMRYYKSNDLSLVRLQNPAGSNSLNEHEEVVWSYSNYVPWMKHFDCYTDHHLTDLNIKTHEKNATEWIWVYWKVNKWDLKYFDPIYTIYESENKLIKIKIKIIDLNYELWCEQTKCTYKYSRASGRKCNQDIQICIETRYPKKDLSYNTCADVNRRHGNCISKVTPSKNRQDSFGLIMLLVFAFVLFAAFCLCFYVKRKRKLFNANLVQRRNDNSDIEPIYEEIKPRKNTIYEMIYASLFENIGHSYDSITVVDKHNTRSDNLV